MTKVPPSYVTSYDALSILGRILSYLNMYGIHEVSLDAAAEYHMTFYHILVVSHDLLSFIPHVCMYMFTAV